MNAVFRFDCSDAIFLIIVSHAQTDSCGILLGGSYDLKKKYLFLSFFA